MTQQILLNLLIGMLWMLLHDRWEVDSFVVGYAIGLLIVYGLRKFFPDKFYVRRLWVIIKLLYLFVRELVKSTFVVIRQVSEPRLSIEPGIFRVQTKLKSDWEITLLSMLITLTPGSVVMEIVSGEESTMYIHAMDATEFTESITESKRIFEEAILEVTN